MTEGDPAPASGDERPAPERAAWERAAWVIVGLLLVQWSIRMYGSSSTYPWVIVLVVVIGAWGLTTAAAALLPASRSRLAPWRGPWSWATVAVVLVSIAAWSILQVHGQPGYGTDEIAFDQYAAQLARHGIDPYLRSMAPSFPMFRVPPDAYTYTLSGTPVTHLSYPALAFELYLPFLALGWSTQLAIALNVAAWMVAVLVLFVLLPRSLRPVALVVGSLSTFVAYAVGGVTDVLYVPLLLGVAYRWNTFGTRRGPSRWIAPVLLGLAMAVKQTPWLLAPFVLAGVVLEVRDRGPARMARTGAAYAGVAAAAFLIPNVPYIVASPAAWWHGILTPFTSHSVPAGQGVVGLSVFLGVGGGSLDAYSALALTVLVASLVVFVATYPRLAPATFLLPSFALFFASRSFGSYLATFFPAVLLAAATGRRSPGAPAPAAGPRVSRRTRWTVVGAAAATVTAVLVATLSQRPPLAVRVVGLRTTGQLATVGQLQVDVTNRSGRALRPAFTVDEGGSFTTFWPAVSGPARLLPGHGATYTLVAPNFFSQAPLGGGFQVAAFTTDPASVSTSASYQPATLHVGLTPDAVNEPVPVGTTVTIRAQLYDQFDRPVASADVPVYLGQVIYDQRGLILSEAAVNGRSPGQTPVEALTGPGGSATFRIVGTQATSDPVSFEANLVSATHYYPYGYSEIVPIRFVPAR